MNELTSASASRGTMGATPPRASPSTRPNPSRRRTGANPYHAPAPASKPQRSAGADAVNPVDPVDHEAGDFVVEEERVVAAAGEDDDVPGAEACRCDAGDQAILGGDDGGVWDEGLGRALANATQERASPVQVGADEERRDVDPAKGARERDRAGDARMAR